MVSTLIILFAAALSLFLVWTTLRAGLPQIRSLDDWETKKHDVDLKAFRVLLDPAEEEYLRASFTPSQFRRFQRRRLGLALCSLDLIAKNAAMLMKLGQLAKSGATPELAKEAEDLVYGALRLRVNLMFVQPYLRLKWLFPGWMLSVPRFALPYEELLSYLNRVRQQRRWDLNQVPMAG
jgi:hypothetical protein